MKKEWFQKKWFIVLLHMVCWAVLFSLPYLLKPERDNNQPGNTEKHEQAIFWLMVIMRMLWMVFFYLNANLLFPRFVYKKKYGLYGLILLLILSFMMMTDILFFHYFIPDKPYHLINYFVFNLFPLLFLWLASSAYRLAIDRIKTERREKDRITENLKTELSLLRSQVSPHFMFNVLNNMVALARKKSDVLEPSLIKLSQLLRYMLYETHEKVPLQKEVEYLQSYIDLQQQRFGKALQVHSNFNTGEGYHDIEPMLLIPFVENAFKHGAVMIEQPEIFIDMRLQKNSLLFTVKNKFKEGSQEVKDKTSGIGMGNVKRRLDLLYPKHHQLDIHKNDDWYEVTLKIEL